MAYSPLLRAVRHGVGQPYPSRPIRIIVPFVPGGNVDITARTVRAGAGDALGQPVVVENRPGAAGMVGAQAMMSSPADGYTLMMGSNSSLAVAPNLYPSWPYDPIKGIAPISNLAITPFVLVVKLGLPAQSLADLVKLAKEKPGQLSMASGGNGLVQSSRGRAVPDDDRVEVQPRAYKGTGAALVDLAGGQVDLLFDQASSTVPNVARRQDPRPWRSPRAAARARCRTRRRFAEAGLRRFRDR